MRILIQFGVLFPLFMVLGWTQGVGQPSIKEYATLLEQVAHSRSSKSLPAVNLERLVRYVQLEEVDSLTSPSEPGSNRIDSSIYENRYRAMDRLVIYSRTDSRCIGIILRISSLVRRNAEFAEAMPLYKARVLRDNTKGFLDIFLGLSREEQKEAASELDWDDTIDSEKVVNDFVRRTTVAKYKQAAQLLLSDMALER